MIEVNLSNVGKPTEKMFQYAMIINGWVHAVPFADLYKMDYDQCHHFIEVYKDHADQLRQQHDKEHNIRRSTYGE